MHSSAWPQGRGVAHLYAAPSLAARQGVAHSVGYYIATPPRGLPCPRLQTAEMAMVFPTPHLCYFNTTCQGITFVEPELQVVPKSSLAAACVQNLVQGCICRHYSTRDSMISSSSLRSSDACCCVFLFENGILLSHARTASHTAASAAYFVRHTVLDH